MAKHVDPPPGATPGDHHGIELGPGVVLPEDLVTQTIAILGKRGSGKTTAARVLAEGLLESDLPVCVLDPTGVWFGLRTSADGAADGYPVVIFGGEHGDVPLEETAGAVIAEVIVQQRLSAVLDLSLLSKVAMRRFAADFLQTVFLLNREPRHIVVDEADILAPKAATRETARTVDAMEDLFRRGRVKGLGATAITQRAASLHNGVLNMAEMLIALRMTGVRDVAAVDDWVRLHADDDDAREVKASLPSLPTGQGWLWSPGWLGVLKRVEVRRPRTFDSSATPQVGQNRPTVRRMAAVDLAALGQQIAATVDEAKDNDPAELRRQLAELRRQLASREPPPAPEVVEVRIEVPVLDEAAITSLQRAVAKWLQQGEQLLASAASLQARLDQIELGGGAADASAGRALTGGNGQAAPTVDRPPRPAPPAAAGTPRYEPRGEALPLPKAQRAILTALAQHGRRTTTQVALLTGYSSKSGGYRNALSALRTGGLIEGHGDIAATPVGLQALGSYDPLPAGSDLRQWWKDHQLGKAERAVLDVLAAAWPESVPVEQIAAATSYSASGGGFRNALSRLRSLDLAAGRGALVLNDTLAGPRR